MLAKADDHDTLFLAILVRCNNKVTLSSFRSGLMYFLFSCSKKQTFAADSTSLYNSAKHQF